MANATGTPQSALYQARGISDGNSIRNRSAEQQHSYNSGNPMNYSQFMNGQDPSLSRYTPSTLTTRSPTSPQWSNNPGGYAYNLPTAFGGFGGFSQFSQNPGLQSMFEGASNNATMQAPQNSFSYQMGQAMQNAAGQNQNYQAPSKPAVAQQPGYMPPIQGQRALPPMGGPRLQGAAQPLTKPAANDLPANPSYEQLLAILRGGARTRGPMQGSNPQPGGTIGGPQVGM